VLGSAALGSGAVEKNAIDVLVVEKSRTINELVEHAGRQQRERFLPG